jgi:hypothetical protein
MRSVRSWICLSPALVSAVAASYSVLAQPSDTFKAEFRRVYSYSNSMKETVVPGPLAKRLGWSDGRNVVSHRRSWSERRNDNNALLRRYAADAVVARPDEILITFEDGIAEPGLSEILVCWVFNSQGRILRVIEIRPKQNWAIIDVIDGRFDQRGHEVWKIISAKVPN